MTKQEQIDKIKKSLAVCVGASCEGCEYHDDLACGHTLKTDARELIIEQEQEIERLKDENKENCWKCIEAKRVTEEDYAKLQEEFANYQIASDKEMIAQVKQAQIEEIAKFDKLCYDYNKLLYIIRCNMTSITRYIRNENEAYDIKYKELAEKAVENILEAINHRGEE